VRQSTFSKIGSMPPPVPRAFLDAAEHRVFPGLTVVEPRRASRGSA